MDDDGTKFVWDSTLRKFRPEDMAALQADAGTQQQAAASTVAPAATGEYTQVPTNENCEFTLYERLCTRHDDDFEMCTRLIERHIAGIFEMCTRHNGICRVTHLHCVGCTVLYASCAMIIEPSWHGELHACYASCLCPGGSRVAPVPVEVCVCVRVWVARGKHPWFPAPGAVCKKQGRSTAPLNAIAVCRT